MSHADQLYGDILFDVLADGERRETRSGPVRALFGLKATFDLTEFPLLTTKRLHVRSIVAELAWFLQGLTNNNWLVERGVTIWNEWADATGELGPIYGKQWRSWPCPDGRSVDQISNVLRSIREAPTGRRHLVSAWNPADIEAMALPPCHCLFQFYVTGDGRLDCQLYQRSADVFLGLPFNIASYALLTCMVAAVSGLKPGRLLHVIGDAHLYENHVEAAQQQLIRPGRPAPLLRLPEAFDLFQFEPKAVRFEHYDPHPAIPAEVAA